MAGERRYTEREIALIIEQASASQDLEERDEVPKEGLTLAELQEIGNEIGISSQLVARAASAVDLRELAPTSQSSIFGLPVGVSRTIEFGREISDTEWEHLVVTFRETFAARGNLQQQGSFRQWTNGNLQALLEPTPSGHRLRLVTRKGDARGLIILGLLGLGGGLLMALATMVGGTDSNVAATAVIWSVLGVGSLIGAFIRLPRWAKTRAAQMEAIAASVLEPEQK
jgi:hypothetical protein